MKLERLNSARQRIFSAFVIAQKITTIEAVKMKMTKCFREYFVEVIILMLHFLISKR